jgi:hypothetical protein
MQAMKELAGLLCLRQPLAMECIPLSWNLLDLFKQSRETGRREQDLGLTKRLEFARRRTTTDPALMTAQSPKQAFQF